MDVIEQPEQRVGDEPQPAEVDGQLQVRCHGLKPLLHLGTHVEGGTQGGVGARRQGLGLAGEGGDVAVLAVGGGVEEVVLLLRRYPGGGEVVLDDRDPAALDLAVLEVACLDVLEVDLLVAVLRRGVRRAEEGTHAHLGASGRIRVVVAGQLADEACADRLLASVGKQVADVDRVVVTAEGEALDDVDAIDGGGHVHLQAVLAVGQAVLGLLGREGNTTAVAVKLQSRACDVAQGAVVGQQHVGPVPILAHQMLGEGGVDDVAALGVDTHVEDVGDDRNEISTVGSGLVAAGQLAADIIGRAGRRQAFRSGGVGTVGGRVAGDRRSIRGAGRLTIVLVPLHHDQVGEHRQGDQQE